MPISYDDSGNPITTLLDGALPIPRGAGLRIPGYFVWGGSVIRVGDAYHMFASRWPVETGFPDGYRSHSEIVRATATNPLGPYAFREVVVAGRGGDYWDGQMAHNPTIHRTSGGFALYYIGSPCQPNATGFRFRKVGLATSASIEGPWARIDEPLSLGQDANNPAPCFRPNGSLLLNFRDLELRMGIASAPSVAGPYRVESSDIMPGYTLEDGYLYGAGGSYHIICEDNRGHVSGHQRWGVHLVSVDGIHGWRPADPAVAYTHTVVWDDGTRTTFERRERPQLLFDGQGRISHLCTAVLYQGQSLCLVQPVRQAT